MFFCSPRCNEFNGTLSADFGIELETEEEEEEEQVETRAFWLESAVKMID